MNENVDLTKILKNCPEDFELYTPLHGKVYFSNINENGKFPIVVKTELLNTISFTKEGYYFIDATNGECLLLPSNEMRDWSKFITPWYKKERFDPKTLQPFDKVIAKCNDFKWYVRCFLIMIYRKVLCLMYVLEGSITFVFHTMKIPNILWVQKTKLLTSTNIGRNNYFKFITNL